MKTILLAILALFGVAVFFAGWLPWGRLQDPSREKPVRFGFFLFLGVLVFLMLLGLFWAMRA